jgi:hypothetical protein
MPYETKLVFSTAAEFTLIEFIIGDQTRPCTLCLVSRDGKLAHLNFAPIATVRCLQFVCAIRASQYQNTCIYTSKGAPIWFVRLSRTFLLEETLPFTKRRKRFEDNATCAKACILQEVGRFVDRPADRNSMPSRSSIRPLFILWALDKDILHLPFDLRIKIVEMTYRVPISYLYLSLYQDRHDALLSEIKHCVSKARRFATTCYEYEPTVPFGFLSFRRFWNHPSCWWFITDNCDSEMIRHFWDDDEELRLPERDTDGHSLKALQLLFRTSATDLYPGDVEFHHFVYELDNVLCDSITSYLERFNTSYQLF